MLVRQCLMFVELSLPWLSFALTDYELRALFIKSWLMIWMFHQDDTLDKLGSLCVRETVFLTGLSPPVKYFTDRSKAVLLLWIFYVFVLSCVCYVLCASVYMCFVVTCWERADLLALVCGVFCEFVTFPLVSWVRCGTWLYRFLIFATLFTLCLDNSRIFKGIRTLVNVYVDLLVFTHIAGTL